MPFAGPSAAKIKTGDQQGYLLPIILVTSLFFLWGLAYGLLDVLNKHFQDSLNITKQRSTLLQAAYFGAYFIMAIPAGLLMNRTGYKTGIIAGLALYALGALLFFPAAQYLNFEFFLFALFILASGLTFLETAANPYVTVLGPAKSASFRLNLSQSFNGIGSFIGPIIGGLLFFNTEGHQQDLSSVKMVYVIIAAIVLVIAFCFFITPLPEISADEEQNSNAGKSLFRIPHFKAAVWTQFFYVAAQVGAASLFINYCTEKNLGISNEDAAYLLSGSLLLFTIGRFLSTAIMKIIPPAKLLSIYAMVNILLCVVVMFVESMLSVYSLMAIFFFESIMFPTIFALGLRDLGSSTKKGASFLVMAVAGGAIVPFVMGSFESTSIAFVVPLICFVFVLYFGLVGHKVRTDE